jgi:hypothetical protein
MGEGAFAGEIKPVENALTNSTVTKDAVRPIKRIRPESTIVNTLLSPFSQSLRF